MEWHSADGTVVSADEWERGGADAEPAAETSPADPAAEAEASADAAEALASTEPPATAETTSELESVSEAAGNGGDSATE